PNHRHPPGRRVPSPLPARRLTTSSLCGEREKHTHAPAHAQPRIRQPAEEPEEVIPPTSRGPPARNSATIRFLTRTRILELGGGLASGAVAVLERLAGTGRLGEVQAYRF